MPLPHIIAITGNAGHGKDTCAEYLSVRYGYARYALAEPIKEAVLPLFGWDAQRIQGEGKEQVDPRYGISPRQALQALGTEFAQEDLCRLFHPFALKVGRRLWVLRLLERSKDEPYVVVSDCRFPHEADTLRKAGAKIVRVLRPSVPVDMTHESERGVGQITPDYMVPNTGSIAQLQRALDGIMHEMMGVRP